MCYARFGVDEPAHEMETSKEESSSSWTDIGTKSLTGAIEGLIALAVFYLIFVPVFSVVVIIAVIFAKDSNATFVSGLPIAFILSTIIACLFVAYRKIAKLKSESQIVVTSIVAGNFIGTLIGFLILALIMYAYQSRTASINLLTMHWTVRWIHVLVQGGWMHILPMLLMSSLILLIIVGISTWFFSSFFE